MYTGKRWKCVIVLVDAIGYFTGLDMIGLFAFSGAH